eukprot:870358-Karenia_brevis.AAC.1
MQRNHDNSPGFDGLPYSAWEAIGRDGARALYGVWYKMKEDAIAPWGFNWVAHNALPKKVTKDHLGGVAVPADGVRAIGKANTDNENIGKAAASCVNP